MIHDTIGRRALVLAGIILAASAASAAQVQPPKIPGFLAAAVADPARPAANVERDVNRKPAETLVFAGVEPGFKVAEILPGGWIFHAHHQQGRRKLGPRICAGTGAASGRGRRRPRFLGADQGRRRGAGLFQCQRGG